MYDLVVILALNTVWCLSVYSVEGGGGWEPGRKGGGRWDKRGQEAGFPRWWEAGEKGKNYTTLCNILQSKKSRGRRPTKIGWEPGLKGSGSGDLNLLAPPPPTTTQSS